MAAKISMAIISERFADDTTVLFFFGSILVLLRLWLIIACYSAKVHVESLPVVDCLDCER
jgi:hypothetical protein